MATVANLIDQCYRDYLGAPDDQPTRFKLSAPLAQGATSATTSTALLSPEEEDLLGPGTVIEIDREWLLVEAVTGTSPNLTLTVRRGMSGTTDTSHADGALIYLAPTFSRQSVFDAVSDSIDDLWPRLWAVKSSLVATSGSWTEVGSDVEEIVEARVQLDDGRWEPVGPPRLMRHFALASSGFVAQWPHDIQPNTLAMLVYKARPVRPTTEDDDLADLNVDPSWNRIVCLGAAAYLVGARDIDAATNEFITETLAREGFPVGAGESIRNALIRLRDALIAQKAKALAVASPDYVTVERPF